MTATEQKKEFTYVCPICGYTDDRRLNTASHLVDRHMICASKTNVEKSGGVEEESYNRWRKGPDVEKLKELVDEREIA